MRAEAQKSNASDNLITQPQILNALALIQDERTVGDIPNSYSETKQGFSDVYARNIDAVYRVCFSFLKNSADAEDLSQETFLRYLDRNVKFESERHEKAWFIVTASNLCKNEIKSWRRKTQDIDEHIELGFEQNFDSGETLRAIMALPNDYKTIVYMYYYEGYSTPEIAKLLKRPDATVRTRLARARKLLKSSLGDAVQA